MADYIFIRRGRNILSSILHVFFNLSLAIISIFVTYLTKTWLLGILFVLLSKWRIFAVRPRYWLLNLKSNLVDLIVGISFVLLAFCSGEELSPAHFILAALYALWLVVLKPKSSLLAARLQAMSALFLGSAAAVLTLASTEPIFLVATCFLLGYASTRHVLVQSDDENYGILPLTVGLIAAELARLSHSWLIVYTFAPLGVLIPQLSLVFCILACLISILYRSVFRHEGKLVRSETLMPILFSFALIAIVLIWFSEPIFNV